MKIIRFCSFLLAAGFLSASTGSAVPFITNGSFEDPAEAPNSLTEITSTGVPGWTGNSIGGNAHEYIVNGDIQDGSGRDIGVTPFGAQYLGLNAVKNNSFHSIETQVVTGFTAGQAYMLTLYIANLDGATDPNIYVSASANSGTGTLLNSATFTAPVSGPYGATGTINFVQETLTFTALTDTVSFSINNSSKTGIMGIDNVSLTAVPEPTTTTALLLGAAGLTGLALRRRRQAV